MSKASVAIGGLVVVGAIGFFTCTERIPQGNVGVVYNQFNGGVQEETLSEGRQFAVPWAKVNLFPVSTEVVYMSADKREGSEENESLTVSCNDGSLNADLTYSYSFKADDVPKVQKKYRGKDGHEIMNTVLRGQLRSWVSEVTKNYSSMEVHLTKKEEVNAKLTEHLANKGKGYGVTFESVALAETRASAEVQQAIEKRQQIAQELEQQKMNLEKTEIAKQQEKLEADRKLIEAEGDRKANEEKAKGLDQNILEKMKIEKWNGELSTVQGQGTNPIINLK